MKDFICPYHQWSYDLAGDLQGVPFRRGVTAATARWNGGMPADFKLEDTGLMKLKVEAQRRRLRLVRPRRRAARRVPRPEVMPWLERVFNGRKLHVLGYSRQRIPGNWKLMQENIKDPYHPGLLHTWFVDVRPVARRPEVAARDGREEPPRGDDLDASNEGGKGEVTQGVSSFKENMKLNDPRVLDVVPEPWWNGPTA